MFQASDSNRSTIKMIRDRFRINWNEKKIKKSTKNDPKMTKADTASKGFVLLKKESVKTDFNRSTKKMIRDRCCINEDAKNIKLLKNVIWTYKISSKES